MLKSKALAQVLEQANSGGVRNTVLDVLGHHVLGRMTLLFKLLNNEGSLLAFAGEDDRDSKVRATIASSIWVSYEKQGKLLSPPTQCRQMILACLDGSVLITKVPCGLLCLFAGKGAGIGMLRLKANKLAAFLEEPLKLLGK